ncbi:hypothetical protein HWA77_02955 [Photobacterium damselae subsp. damselae]|uniref:DUF2523 domain-containing protein n=1 Tax=Photobacterium damselae subsp. damselae TaxID=85581 RepID=A0A850QHY5_PHODD|nr:hypothetical protein [Photobacterium damselae subsp. damselae]
METLYSGFQAVIGVLLHAYDFLLYLQDYVYQFFTYLSIHLMILYIELKIYFFNIAGSVATKILQQYGVYDLIEVVFNKLPSSLRFILNAYGIPQGFRIIFDAYASSLLLRFIGK